MAPKIIYMNTVETKIDEVSQVSSEITRKNNFDDRSEIAQEIISRKPDFIEKWAMVFFLVILLLLFTGTWFIKYPDTIKTKAQLTSVNAPKEVLSLISGKVIKMMATEGAEVAKGDVLGFLEANADHSEVIDLRKQIESAATMLQAGNEEKLLSFFHEKKENLGELQQNYEKFLQSFMQFKNYTATGFYIRKKGMLRKDLSNLSMMNKTLLLQKQYREQDIKLSQQDYDANTALKQDKIISDLDHRTEESKLINKMAAVPQIQANIINNNIQNSEKLKEINELDNTISQQKNIFYQALQTFKSEIIEWERKYLLVAPIAGKIAFASFIQENQQVYANQTILFINPDNAKYFAQLTVPQTNFGKIAVGQKVILKFSSYSFQEFGTVKGRIDFVSNIPTDSGYLAKVTLDNGLKTSSNYEIKYRDGLLANAEIVTKDMRLLQRFYNNLVEQLQK